MKTTATCAPHPGFGVRHLWAVVAVLLVAGLGGYYRSLPERPPLARAPSPAWSRAPQLGTASPFNPPALAVHPDGGASLVWVARQAGVDRLDYARVSPGGDLLFRRTLPVTTAYPQYPRITLDAAGRLHLAWLESDPSGGRRASYVRIAPDGALDSPVQVSTTGRPVGALDLFVTTAGDAGVLWSGAMNRDEGLFFTRIDARGQTAGSPVEIDGRGMFPSVQVDRQGAVHAVWLRTSQDVATFVYSRVDPTTGQVEPSAVAALPSRQAVAPLLALDWANGYVLWQQRERRADGRVDDRVLVTSFPLDRPGLGVVRALTLIDPPSPGYQPAAEVPLYRQIESVRDPAVAPGQRDRVALAVSARVANLRHEPTLLVQGVLEGGEFARYRLGSLSRFASVASAIAEDDAGNLSVTWLDGRGENDNPVRFATTAPAAVRNLAAPTRADLRDDLFWAALAVAATLAFTPVLFVLSALALALLALLWWLGEPSPFVRRYGVLTAIAVQVVVYVGFGQALVPGGIFEEWVPPALHQTATLYGYPFACTVVGLIAFLIHRHSRGEAAGPFSSLAVFALAAGWAAGLAYFLYTLPRL
ncbi:MAG: hypothetical protein HY331_10715 [Chloroflexi bacterium]|nr:hypothetical protein [Chloroflexota bacterium]